MLWWQMAYTLIDANMVKSIGKDVAKFGLILIVSCGYIRKGKITPSL